MSGYLPDGVRQSDIDRHLEEPEFDQCVCGAKPGFACESWCGLTDDDEDTFWRDLDESRAEWKEGVALLLIIVLQTDAGFLDAFIRLLLDWI